MTVVLLTAVPLFFFFNDTATTEIYTLSLHDALPICAPAGAGNRHAMTEQAMHGTVAPASTQARSEEHTSELQSRLHLVCRLLLEKKKDTNSDNRTLPTGHAIHHPAHILRNDPIRQPT